MAKKTDYIAKTEADLLKALSEKREELRTLRFSSAGARAKDTNAKANVRKEIARILTAMTAKKSA
jgi:ribosomal protein L29